MKRVIVSLLALWSVSASFGQGALDIHNSILITLGEQPGEQTYRDLTRHVRLTLPSTYFTGPIIGDGEDIGILSFISPGFVDGFTPILAPGGGTFPGLVFFGDREGMDNFGPAIDLEFIRNQLVSFNGEMLPPSPPVGLNGGSFFNSSGAFVKLPGDRIRRILPATDSVSEVAPVTVPEPSSILLLSLIGTGCWFFRRRA